MAANNTKHKLVILGAGFGGLTAARAVEEASEEDAALLEAVLVSAPGPAVVGAFAPMVLKGKVKAEQVTRTVAPGGLNLSRVALVPDVVQSIDTENKVVRTKAGEISYDDLVVSLGVEYYDAVPGLNDAAFNLCDTADMVALRGALLRAESGTVVVAVGSLPYKCPPLPYEAAFAVDAVLREAGKRDAFRVVVTTPMAQAVPPFAPHVFQDMMAAKGIEFKTKAQPSAVDAVNKTVTFDDGESLEYTLLAATLPQRAPAVVREAMPIDDPRGFVVVDPKSLRTSVPHVYVIGDSATVKVNFAKAGLKVQPKAGKFAMVQAKTAVQAVLADARAAAAGESTSWDAPVVATWLPSTAQG
ncbi:FAD-dependent pyridine nucleotide-disulfide oxidoreductase [Thecamonas trahens ATCC 50062]|uniref:FAD-dependent pyridine nucleotide-disulfide oxidoreductase n=1 Tax=Thecamonas trahens ATCC 50062 TaxID=461836 RepID=A0A0L0DDF3_THETB|nr:FAD-dependent pyridine nucleotide-disulfide oxidoreductase [Thecamonas trahens ATCC 50062]KNC50121.1 FAD-dependent pyridine nucleotide-disulfide oxidoreductase [Thecamonas trahens ATCC 50062]|eukprot:XP_013757280.1 FAD-dependent pyridine nucleotide-disulfide oxidoreductase [Thecamonas trahens ATCC 50062]